jgi:WD40 repeat protein
MKLFLKKYWRQIAAILLFVPLYILNFSAGEWWEVAIVYLVFGFLETGLLWPWLKNWRQTPVSLPILGVFGFPLCLFFLLEAPPWSFSSLFLSFAFALSAVSLTTVIKPYPGKIIRTIRQDGLKSIFHRSKRKILSLNYPVIASWLLTITLFCLTTYVLTGAAIGSGPPYVIPTGAGFNAPSQIIPFYSTLLLPLLIIIRLHYFNRYGEISNARKRKTILTAGVLLLLFTSVMPFLLVREESTIMEVAVASWYIFATVLAIVLTGTMYGLKTKVWWVLMNGLLAGSLLIIFLLPLMADLLVPDSLYFSIDAFHLNVVSRSVLIIASLILILLTGPLTASVIGEKKRMNRLMISGVTTSFIFVLIYSGIFSTIGGIFSFLGTSGLDAENFAPDEYTLNMLASITRLVPYQVSIFLSLLLVGLLLGSITGSIPLPRISTVREPSIFARLGTIVFAFILLHLLLFLGMSLSISVNETIGSGFDVYGVEPFWKQSYNPLLLLILNSIPFFALQIYGLSLIRRLTVRREIEKTYCFTFSLLLAGLGFLYSFFIISIDPDIYIEAAGLLVLLPIALLGMATLIIGLSKRGAVEADSHTEAGSGNPTDELQNNFWVLWSEPIFVGAIFVLILGAPIFGVFNAIWRLVTTITAIEFGSIEREAWIYLGTQIPHFYTIIFWLGLFSLFVFGLLLHLSTLLVWIADQFIYPRFLQARNRFQSRGGQKTPYMRKHQFLIVLGLMLISILLILFEQPYLLVLAITPLAIAFFSKEKISRLPLTRITLAYMIAWLGLLPAIWLLFREESFPEFLGYDVELLFISLLILLGIPSLVIAYRTFRLFVTPSRQKTIAWLFLFLFSIAFALLMSSGQPEVDPQGGLAIFDENGWHNLSTEISVLGGQLKYEIMPDRFGDLWLATDSGLIVSQSNLPNQVMAENAFSLFSQPSSAPNNQRAVPYEAHFARTSEGKLWVAHGNHLAHLDSTLGRSRIPGSLSDIDAAFLNKSEGNCTTEIVGVWSTTGVLQRYLMTTPDVSTLIPSPDGEHLLVSDDSSVRYEMWTLEGEPVSAFETEAFIEFSPDGQYLLLMQEDSAALYDLSGNLYRELNNLEQDTELLVERARFLPSGQVVVDTRDGQLALYEPNSATWSLLSGHESYNVLDIAISSTESLWASLDSNHEIILRNHQGDARERLFFEDKAFNAIAFTGDEHLVATTDNELLLYDLSGRQLDTYLFENLSTLETSSLNSSVLLASSPYPRKDIVWLDIENGKFNELKAYEGVNSGQLSPDGTHLIITQNNGEMFLETTELNFQLFGTTSAFFPNSDLLAVSHCIEDGNYQSFVEVVNNDELGFDNNHITDIEVDADGNVWIGTDARGVVRFAYDRQIEEGEWQNFGLQEGLPHLNIKNIKIRSSGEIWAATAQGIAVLDGPQWRPTVVDSAASRPESIVFLESEDDFLVGTAAGVFYWNGEEWKQKGTIFSDNTIITHLRSTNDGAIWAGANDGLYRLNDNIWENVIDRIVVTELEVEGNNLWVGTESGLIRYDMRSGNSTVFDSGNSGLPTDVVNDIFIDAKNNDVWVATYEETMAGITPVSGLLLSFVLFGVVYGSMFIGYKGSPQKRGYDYSKQISSQTFFPIIYQILDEESQPFQVLEQMSGWLKKTGDLSGSAILSDYINVGQANEEQLPGKMMELVETLSEDTTRPDSNNFADYYTFLQTCLTRKNINGIIRLELQVGPASDARGVDISTAATSAAFQLPSYFPKAADRFFRCLEEIMDTLRKIDDAEAALDKLSYLADALNIMDKSRDEAARLSFFDAAIFNQIIAQWNGIIIQAIDVISGRADLRLELRTKQIRIRKSERATILLRLQNNGRAAAENIVVTLRDEAEELDCPPERLARLAADQSDLVEFTIDAGGLENRRFLFEVTWDDRTGKGHHLVVGDVVHFYEQESAYQTILNPYIVGHPIKSGEVFYGREDIFKFIQENLSNPQADRTIVLHGQRRTGKTSILYQLQSGRLGANFLAVLIDMQEMAPIITSTADFLSEIAYQLTRPLKKTEFDIEDPSIDAFDKAPVRVFNRFLDQLEDKLGNRQLIIMFDEFELIEDKIEEGKLEADLLGYFRSLMQHRTRLVFIFTGTHRLEEMSHDYWSILFNIALYKRVSYLEEADAVHLIREPIKGQLDVDELAVDKIINLSHGHPYFIQLICWALVNHCNDHRQNYATINDVNDAVKDIIINGEANFAYVWQQADPDERLLLCSMAHTLHAGKPWARVSEIMDTLATNGATFFSRDELVTILDRLVTREVLQIAKEGSLRYQYRLEILRLWIQATKSVANLVERRDNQRIK